MPKYFLLFLKENQKSFSVLLQTVKFVSVQGFLLRLLLIASSGPWFRPDAWAK